MVVGVGEGWGRGGEREIVGGEGERCASKGKNESRRQAAAGA
jgi:hypothetical protein